MNSHQRRIAKRAEARIEKKREHGAQLLVDSGEQLRESIRQSAGIQIVGEDRCDKCGRGLYDCKCDGGIQRPALWIRVLNFFGIKVRS